MVSGLWMLGVAPLVLSLHAPALQPGAGDDSLLAASPQSFVQMKKQKVAYSGSFLAADVDALAPSQQHQQHQQQQHKAAESRTISERGLVLMKLARTGSTWLIEALNSTGAWCLAKEEVTDEVFSERRREKAGLEGDGDCAEAKAVILKTLRCKRPKGLPEGMHGAFSLNPLKFAAVVPDDFFDLLDIDGKEPSQRVLDFVRDMGWRLPSRGDAAWQRADRTTQKPEKKGHTMTCRREEVDAMQSAAPGNPPLVVSLVRTNLVQQAASLMFARDLAALVRPDCIAYNVNPETCNETEIKMAAQPLPFEVAKLLNYTRLYKLFSQTVRDLSEEIAAELGTEHYELTTEDMQGAGDDDSSFALPKGLEQFLGLPHGIINPQAEESGAHTNKDTHQAKSNQARLRATISNFDEVQAYFEKHADPKYTSMLQSKALR